MTSNVGASLEAWHHWSETLGLAEHLLPVVANPKAEISPDSHMKKLGKTPSRYNYKGLVAGFGKWTEFRATKKDIDKWELESDYGICMQSRQGGLRAIDIDIISKVLARKVMQAIFSAAPHLRWPQRYREDTGKVLLPFRYEGFMPKRVIPVDGGIIEFLGDGQQWIAESSYLKGDPGKQRVDGRYLWRGGWPKTIDDIPLLTDSELENIWETLVMMFANGEAKIARERREGVGVDTSAAPGLDDPIYDHLLSKWEVRETKTDGTLFIRCPFADGHSGDSGPSETQYMPAGTGGYEKGHFKCLHASCMHREDSDYIEAIGYSPDMSDAPELPAEVEEAGTAVEKADKPKYMTNKQGLKENRTYNHEVFLRSDDCPMQIVYDHFTAEMLWCPREDLPGEERWRRFSDEHYPRLVIAMDRHGFVPQSPAALRPSVLLVAKRDQIDLASAWAARLPEWDGVERIATFWSHYAKADDTPYTRAVALYGWTAQAGRLLDPGCQVDMVPILVGAQGVRKSSLIAAIAPHRDWFTEVNLMERDDDTSRKMRGKLVAELGELRGMHARDKEDVKAFITRRDEEWVPKYHEFAKTFRRRLVMYGSTNKDEFLADETGERRWLPIKVGLHGSIDVEATIADREQLWAEAIVRWRYDGVIWAEAEQLAAGEHEKYKEVDPWLQPVCDWLLRPGALNDPGSAPVDMPYEWCATDVAVGALRMRSGDVSRGVQMRIAGILKSLGAFKKKVFGKGQCYRLDRKTFNARREGDDDAAGLFA